MSEFTLSCRPWGCYETILKTDGYQIKRITVNPGKRISLQYHNFRSEHWVIVSGSGLATINDEIIGVSKNHHIQIDIKQLHRIENTGNEPLIFIEVQVGDYLEEDDIVRIEDDYNRC